MKIDKKVINYYSSFFEVSKDLSQKQFYDFNMAIFKVMFFEQNINEIVFEDKMLSIVWKSVKHSLDSSIKGFCDKKNIPYDDIFIPLTNPLANPLTNPLTNNEKEKEKEKGKGKGNKQDVSEKLPNFLNKEVWREWNKHRKEIKKPLTPTAIKQQLEFLEKNKYDHVEIINNSIKGGWTGLFEIKRTAPKRNFKLPSEYIEEQLAKKQEEQGYIESEIL